MIIDNYQRPLYYLSLAKAGFITVRDLRNKPAPGKNTVASIVYPMVQDAVPASWSQLPHSEECDESGWTRQLCLFRSSNDPFPLEEATTRRVYHCLRNDLQERPRCIDQWGQHSSLSDSTWQQLWKIPKSCSTNPFQRDCLWKLLHRVLPTKDKLFLCHLSPTDNCPACNTSSDSIDHALGTCPVWKSIVSWSKHLLSQMGLSLFHGMQSTLDLFVSSKRPCLWKFFAVLVTTFWRRRGKAPVKAIIAAFKFNLRHLFQVSRAQRYHQGLSFNTYWTPLAEIVNSKLIVHTVLR